MAWLSDEIHTVYGILKKYVTIHDAIFKFSWRKAVPIPGLFKPINYGQHAADLNSLISSLDKLTAGSEIRTGVPDIFSKYILALVNAMRFLRDMCKRLYDLSEGNPQGYTMDLHKSNVAEYEKLVETYYSLGTELNQHLEQ